jgi:hypothetical protein
MHVVKRGADDILREERGFFFCDREGSISFSKIYALTGTLR